MRDTPINEQARDFLVVVGKLVSPGRFEYTCWLFRKVHRFRVQSNESANSSANLDSSTDDFSQLTNSILLDNLTKNEEGTRKVLNVILGQSD